MAILGIPSTRISDQFSRQTLLAQVRGDQVDLLRLENQVSTGRKFQLASEAPAAAMRVVSLQQLLARKTQIKTNLTTNQSFLSTTDSAMSQISGLITDARATALGVIGTTATDDQRQAAALEIQQTLQQLVDVGNRNFRGRYLFAGSDTGTRPFALREGNLVRYDGNQNRLSSYGDVGLLVDTNVSGDEVFGAISNPVRGSIDLNSNVTRDTRLADLFGGRGVPKGNIAVSDGSSTRIIDLSQAETVGDVVAMIHAHPPAGNAVNVEITPTGFTLQLASGDLTIADVGSGTMAERLGILTPRGVGANTVASANLDPGLSSAARLSDVLGSRATAVLRSGGANNDVILTAGENGETLNGATISVVDDPTVQAGSETVAWDPTMKTLTIHVEDAFTTAQNVVDAVHRAFQAEAIPFQAELDPLDGPQGGTGKVRVADTPSVITRYGGGTDLDQDSGLQIVNGAATPYTIDISKAVTVDDLLAALAGSPAGVLAEINSTKTGVDVRSRLSGGDFAIGENGGTTAAQLGLRTFTEQTRLADLNFGRGVDDYQGTADGDFPAEADFRITRNDGVSFTIDVHGAKSVGDVLDRINTNATNSDPTKGVALEARLAADGNGIELVDRSTGKDHLTVTRNPMSTAAVDLGLVPKGQDSNTMTGAGDAAQGAIASAAPNSGLLVRAVGGGTQTNGARIVVEDCGVDPSAGYIHYSVDPNTDVATITIGITPGATTANDVVRLFQNGADVDPAIRELFTVGLDPDGGSPNTGEGVVDVTPGGEWFEVQGGSPDLLTGADANSQETEGLLTALARLQHALVTNDLDEMNRAMTMLDQCTVTFSMSRAELATREQSLDALGQQLESENVDLEAAMSADDDVDMADAVTQLTAKQVAYEASLRAIGQLSQFTLLDFI